jgi:hypothetical protein
MIAFFRKGSQMCGEKCVTMSQRVKNNAEKNMQDLANMNYDGKEKKLKGSDYGIEDRKSKKKNPQLSSTILNNIKKIQESTDQHNTPTISNDKKR